MIYIPFDSRDKKYKSIFGAVAAGTTLRLRLLLKDAASAGFHIRRDDGESYIENPMKKTQPLNDYSWWECDFTPEEGLFWYSFSFEDNSGIHKITNTAGGIGQISDTGAHWQLTVYSADFSTPNWLSGGLIYQIFPDRFYNSKTYKPDVPFDRLLRDDWGGQPAFRQTDDKFTLGNDYFGGDLQGIIEKLGYIKSLGVNCIYLNPIFEAHSNHRYNTADYMKIDPLLGTTEDFRTLCSKAKKQGIAVILDGVFSHTGDDSIYFNRKNRYNVNGAYNSKQSDYYHWYNFTDWPDKYDSWWGVPSLPEVNELNDDFMDFICGENGVIRYWLRQGASGFRLDVADELPDKFLDRLRKCIKAENPDAYLLGEVWENASNKISYGSRRRFLLGRQLDSVMNYPFKDAIISFLLGGNSHDLMETVLDILETYPPQSVDTLMNHIGTHDTERILTVLGAGHR